MKQKQIVLRDPKKIINELENARNNAKRFNLNSDFAKNSINRLVSPDSKERYSLSNNSVFLDSPKGKSVPIINGIPDFTIFSFTALDEKEEQATYHDDEEINEKFDEIVLRPYNYNHFHAKVWLKHLYLFENLFNRITGIPLDNLSVLNCGCGGGFEAQFFAEQGAKIVGFDISQLRAEAAATRFALNNLEGFFYRGDAAILPFENNTFDVVLYHASLHHVPIEEIPKALKEACRVTKKYVILLEPNDSALRLFLENIGFSISIEASGNYAFRLKKSLMLFWSNRFGFKLLAYETRFMKMEHRPNFFASSLIGKFSYSMMNLFAKMLKPFGNEAYIIMEKIKD